MRKVRVPINSFQYGEVSDSLLMRTDSPVYSQSAQELRNMVVMSEGSVKKRPSLRHLAGSSTPDNGLYQSYLMPFIFDDNEKYVIAILDEEVKCYRVTDATTTSDGFELVDDIDRDVNNVTLPFDHNYINQYTHAQYGDVMFICHPLFAPRILTRTSLTTFEISTFTFDQRADGNVTYQPYTKFQAQNVTLDPSGTTGSITLTTSSAYWESGHVGTVVRYGESEIEITGYTSSTVVSGTVVDELRIRLSVLNPFRTIDGSSTVEVTHLDHGFQGGESITFEEASAVGGINSGNLNGARTVSGIIDENTYTFTAGGSASSSEDGGGYVKVVTHAPTRDWDEQSWSSVRGYPAAVAFHENRLCFGGTLSEPDTIWMSQLGKFFNFDVGEAEDTDSINLVAATGDVHEIRYLVSNRDLQVFTSTGELYVPTYLNQAITPTNAQIRKQTPYGSSYVQPVSIDGATIFVAKNSRIVREYLYTDAEDAYTANAISTLASHLIDDPQFMAVAHSGFNLPDSYAVMSLANGDAIVFSSNRAERRASWTKFSVNHGRIGSVCAVGDRMFANVYNTDTSGTGYLTICEFSNEVGDLGLDFNYGYQAENPYQANTYYVNPMLNPLLGGPDEVDVIAIDTNGVAHYLGLVDTELVSASFLSVLGVDLSAYSYINIQYVMTGIRFDSKIQTNPLDASMGNGPATGEVRGLANVVVDMKDTRSIKINERPLIADSGFTGKKEFRIIGYNRDPKITIEQDFPFQLQVNGIVAELII
jgi:hypothetical protein